MDIILNIPHSSTFIPYNNWEGDIDEEIKKWTDLYTDVLFAPKDRDNIIQITFPYSRFFCDAERLESDPMNSIGQGIGYTDFNGCHRYISPALNDCIMNLWKSHQLLLREAIEVSSSNPLLIDCHSFPNDVAPNVDFCIGWNEDESKPSEKIIEIIADALTKSNFKIGFNNPYSNSITPKTNYPYKSVMIEVNKFLYLDEESKLSSMYKINQLLNNIYIKILSI